MLCVFNSQINPNRKKVKKNQEKTKERLNVKKWTESKKELKRDGIDLLPKLFCIRRDMLEPTSSRILVEQYFI
jgi:hypothetical protein